MYQPKRSLSTEEIRYFQHTPSTGDIKVQPELLADLYNLIETFGQTEPAAPVFRRLELESSHGISFSVRVMPNKPLIMVFGKGSQMSKGAYVFTNQTCSPVCLWDKRVTPEQVIECIAHIDSQMQELGYVDPSTGQRVKPNLSPAQPSSTS